MKTITRRTALAAICSVTAPPVAHAQFIQSRADWARMSASAKSGYVMGVLDETIEGAKGADQYYRDRYQCSVDLNLRSGDLSDLVNKAYESPKTWEFSPRILLDWELRKVCIRRINEARAIRGQEPLPE